MQMKYIKMYPEIKSTEVVKVKTAINIKGSLTLLSL